MTFTEVIAELIILIYCIIIIVFAYYMVYILKLKISAKNNSTKSFHCDRIVPVEMLETIFYTAT